MTGNCVANPVEVQRAQAFYLDQIVVFLKSLSDDFPVPLSSKVDIPNYVRKMFDSGTVLVARCGGEIVGAAGGYANNHSSHTAYLSVIATSAHFRKQGVAQMLLEAFERSAKADGMTFIHLETHKTNKRALSFYEKNNYGILHTYEDREDYLLGKRLPWLTSDRPNILLSSVGRRAYLVSWFKDALAGRGEIHVSNSDSMSPAFRAADASTTSPLIYSDDYISFMVDYCKQNRIGAIIPLFDIDIPVLAEHRAEFEAVGCFPVVASEYFAKVCSDKYETYRVLSEHGFDQPKTYLGSDAFIAAVEMGETEFPAFVKPRWGMGSIGIEVAANNAELKVLCDAVRRKVESSYLRFESSVDLDACVLVQEVIAGDEYGMDVMDDLNGQMRGFVVRRKLAMRSGETDVASVIGADSRFMDLACSLASISQHPGNMDVDIFDSDGRLMVLEMNARFGGGYPFSHVSGVNLPRALVAWLRGEECAAEDLLANQLGTYMKDITIVKAETKNGRL